MSIEIDGKSLDVKAEKLDQLKDLFPEFFSEGKIDLTRIKHILGDEEITTPDHYELSWAGKAEARREIQRQSTATLVPDREGSANFDTSENIFIEGENLEVLRMLQKSYFGKVKVIYIDPPYNTGNDSFIYPDDFGERKEEYEKRTGQKNGGGFLNKLDLFKKNTKENGQYHSVWLSMMYPRLYLARNLLREDGVIFISIDDNEQANLKMVADEVFGAENFIATFPWRKRTAKSDVPFGVSQDYEWILCYTKSNFLAGKEVTRKYYFTEDVGKRWRLADITKQATKEERPKSFFALKNPRDGKKYPANPNRVWSITEDTFDDYYSRSKIVFPGDYDFLNITIPAFRVFEEEDIAKSLKKFGSEDTKSSISTMLPKDVGRTENGNKEIIELFEQKIFSFPKPSSLIKYLVKIASEKDSLILDFFAGSGSTAQAVLELNNEDEGNRRFVCVQMPEPTEENGEAYNAGYKTIADICKARIHKVIERITKENKAKLEFEKNELDLGFKSYKLSYSNFKQWQPDIANKEELLKQLEIFKEPLARQSEDSYELVVELLLKSGFPLSAKVERRETPDEVPYYVVENGRVVYALNSLSDALLKEVESLKPKAFLTLGNLFTGEKADEQMTNWKLQLKESNIEFRTI
jgi:adenine-specific DNA-methyltransferase